MSQTLEQKITVYIDLGNELPEVPLDLKNNLNQAFELRPYQTEAFGRFLYYFGNDKLRQRPAQILFHMATGSGKTLIMAGAIIYLYKQGYRNFLFFVNSTNIINKTRENFLNPLSSKYLFSEVITFGDKKVNIREVDNFQTGNEEDINIVFSTIQGLHTRLNTPRENSLTYDDFMDQKIVLISDEAHQYSEIYLVRNEKHFQLYNFDDGKPIEPDFVLFLKKKDADITLHYQVFIEPKGSHLLEYDAWKETFLKSLKQRHKIDVLWKTKKYIGMPFYNEAQRKTDFEDAIKEIIE